MKNILINIYLVKARLWHNQEINEYSYPQLTNNQSLVYHQNLNKFIKFTKSYYVCNNHIS